MSWFREHNIWFEPPLYHWSPITFLFVAARGQTADVQGGLVLRGWGSGTLAGFSSGRCRDESFMRDEHLFSKGEEAGVGKRGGSEPCAYLTVSAAHLGL